MFNLKNKKKIAIVDLDHTLISCNISYEFGLYLYKSSLLSPLRALALILLYLGHKIKLVPLYYLHAISLYVALTKKTGEEYRLLMRQLMEKMEKQGVKLFRPEVLLWLTHRKQEGCAIVVASSSPHFIVEEICRWIEVDVAQGTQYVVDESGYFEKVGQLMSGKKKLDLAISEDTVAISDSLNDFPLLNGVKKAFVVSPSIGLYIIAYLKGWTIIDSSYSNNFEQ